MSCPDPYRPYNPLDPAPTPDAERKAPNALPSDAEIRGLTSALAASGGGSASQDLALDLVLNQIVEQACLATGATGAAIALTRNGVMVCRATTGRTAPDLGVRLDNAGFSAECLRVGTLQRCDDTETDPRVDSTACRLLGVRSILVVPLWYWGEFMGILEIFSPRPNAFGERDEQTLQALAYRIVRHTKQASGHLAGFSARMEDSASKETLAPTSPSIDLKPAALPPMPELMPELISERSRTPIFELKPKRTKATREPGDEWTTWLAICAAVIACLIVGLMIWRLGWARTSAQRSAPPAQTAPQVQELDLTPAAEAAPPTSAQQTAKSAALKPASNAAQPNQSATAADVVISASSKKDVQPHVPDSPSTVLTTAPAPPTADQPPATGGLAIYDEKGKLIYGTPIHPDQPATPTGGKTTSRPKPTSPSTSLKVSQLAARSVSPDASTPSLIDGRFVRLKPELAENLLDQRVEPDYPDAARRAHIQGSVTLETLIGANGKVQQVTPVSGNPQLAEAAVAAVRQWRYRPFTVDGRQVPIRTQVTVSFMLAQ